MTRQSETDFVRSLIATKPIAPPDANMGLIMEAINVVAAVLPFFGGGDEKKKKQAYYAVYDAANALIPMHGADFITPVTSMGIDPGAVATSLSEYLMQDHKISISPAQLIEDAKGAIPLTPTQQVATNIKSNMPLIAAGAGGFILLLLLMRR